MEAFLERRNEIVDQRIKIAELNGKQEIINKYSDAVKEAVSFQNDLRTHMKDQEESIRESFQIYSLVLHRPLEKL